MKHGAWYNIFLPQQYNDGSPIEIEKFRAIQKELAQHFNGVTEFATPLFPMQGSWMGFGFLQTENISIYSVYAENINDARGFLDAAVERWKSKECLDQQALLVTEMAIEVLLK
ncbi:hypothetical protein HYR99_31080 [Candidatus Poribacteria bacterium]|nr:hypothetical protein [Candidatus Poribacteria bacterium]